MSHAYTAPKVSLAEKGNMHGPAVMDRGALDRWRGQVTLNHQRAANASSGKPLNATRITRPKLQQTTIDTMNISRIDPKRRANLDYKKRQFANPEYQQQTYEHRLSFYTLPPTAEITLEEFETWAIDRLKGMISHYIYKNKPFILTFQTVLSELQSCTYRNRSPEETREYMQPILEKYLPLRANSTKSRNLQDERKKDHYSHFILRLVFSDTDSNRQLFSRLETMLFRLRFRDNDIVEQNQFMDNLNLDWEKVGEDEKRELAAELTAISGGFRKGEDQDWYKVDFTRVPELVEARRVLLKRGKAYVQQKERVSLVVAEFQSKLNDALEVNTVCHRLPAIVN